MASFDRAGNIFLTWGACPCVLVYSMLQMVDVGQPSASGQKFQIHFLKILFFFHFQKKAIFAIFWTAILSVTPDILSVLDYIYVIIKALSTEIKKHHKIFAYI